MRGRSRSLNIVVCGTGGQGNVLLSRFIARAFVSKGYHATIGETFGMSQRGGDVMSHVRVSRERPYGPLIPNGQGHVVLSLEPMETIRALAGYGNHEILVISNVRPVHPVICITGERDYPDLERMKLVIREMSAKCWFLDATQISLEMGNTILTNMVMIGALAQTGIVNLTKSDIEGVIKETFPDDVAQTNIAALTKGMQAVESQ
jgi:indolepyruvate ferredoxin oxidoreductase beta subunit